MILWVLKGFVSERGINVIEEWRKGASLKAQARFQVRWEYLSSQAASGWVRPYAQKLRGQKDLWELRFEAENTQYRPIGFFGPDRTDFTILFFAVEKNDRLPPSTFKMAQTRKQLIMKDHSHASEPTQ